MELHLLNPFMELLPTPLEMFIWQDQVGGLEVQNHQGEWVTAHPIEGTLVVNVGDLLMRWSNDVFRFTPHRVINRQSCERYSMVVAWDPDFDTLIEPALFGRISPDSIESAVLEIGDHPSVDAVFVACTNLRIAEKIHSLEKQLGKPVTSSNHAMAWHSLHLAGLSNSQKGWGRLFV